MKEHAFAAYLRVFQPLAAFPPPERSKWAAYVESGQALPAALLVGREEWRGLARALGMPLADEREHALVQRIGATVYVCPLRTELRVLQSLVAFHRSLPDEVADAFVPAREVERAARTLERLRREQPHSRSHIQQAVWHVPLHWFALFDPSERRLSPPAGLVPPAGPATPAGPLPPAEPKPPAEAGLPAGPATPRLVYETSMPAARSRISRAFGVLQELLDDADLVGAVEELRDWLHSFDGDSIIQLDYGGLTRVIPYAELAEDYSVRQVWEALEALEDGDLDRSSELYGELSERWSALRGRESSN